MFGLNKIYIIIIVVAAISVAGGLGYKFVNDLQQENADLRADKATLEANVVILKGAINDQKEAIASLENDVVLIGEVQLETFADFARARDRVSSLEARLSEHNLGYLAANKPGLIENVVNNATDNINRCFEIASGAPLTLKEIEATKPSQINTSCPDLANPNYEIPR